MRLELQFNISTGAGPTCRCKINMDGTGYFLSEEESWRVLNAIDVYLENSVKRRNRTVTRAGGTLEAMEEHLIRKTIAIPGITMKDAAKQLGISARTLVDKRRKLGLDIATQSRESDDDVPDIAGPGREDPGRNGWD